MYCNLPVIKRSAIRCSAAYSKSMCSEEETQFDLIQFPNGDWRLTYRGTDEIGDWLDNLNTRLIKFPKIGGINIKGKVSAGFYDAFRPSIKLISEIPPHSRVFIEGHSLAHALAVYAGVYLVWAKQCDVRCITFGGPRVGNKEFCNAVGDKLNLIAVRRKGDIVPLVPPYLKGYRHLGTHYGSMPTGIYKAWLQLILTWGASPDFTDPAIKAEHIMSAYLKDLS